MRHAKRPLSSIGLLLRVLYVGVCMGVLAWFWVNQSESEAAIAFGWLVVLVTIPAGLIGAWLVGTLFVFAEVTGNAQILGLWLSCTVLGYVQWFVVIPWLWRFGRRELESSSRAA